MGNDSCLTKRLSAYIDLTQAECDYIEVIERDRRVFGKGEVLPIGGHGQHIGVLDAGWAVVVNHRYRHDRITHVFLPGDIVGLAELGGTFDGQSIRMQTDGALCPFPRSEIGRLFTELPRLAALLLAIAGLDQQVLRDRHAALRAIEAEDRLTLFLLDLRARLALPGVGAGNRFRLPMTQAEIGYVIGATDITVNKALKSLADKGWIDQERPYCRLLDREAMTAQVGFIDYYDRIEMGWFPPPR